MGLASWWRNLWRQDAPFEPPQALEPRPAHWDAIPPPGADVLGAATLPQTAARNEAGGPVVLPHVVIPPKGTPEPGAPVSMKGSTSRGYRNRNPGNIDFLPPGRAWNGQVGIEPAPGNGGRARFAVFDSHENGIRALAKQLIKYQTAYKLFTVAGMIDRWAPPSDNNVTSVYVADVAKAVGVGPHDAIDATQYRVLRPMVEAVIRKELGGFPYNAATIDEGLRRAGVMP